MANSVFKKQKEFQSVLPLMKVLGYDARQTESVLIPVEEPDFLFKHEDMNVGIEVTKCQPIRQFKLPNYRRMTKFASCN